MKLHFDKKLAKRFGKQFFLLLASNLFTIILIAAAGILFITYAIRDEDTCSGWDKINTIESLYGLKTDLVKENAIISADAKYYDAIATVYPAEGSDLEKYITDKTARERKIGGINTSIIEVEDLIARAKTCNFLGDQVDQRIKSIRGDFLENSSNQPKLQ
ncbi:MAG: hypothetical protein WCG99_04080 [Candidatus Berkelbacteria bacterium]